MRLLKRVLFSSLAVLLVAAVGAYIFAQRTFTPEPNYLELGTTSNFVPILWSKSEQSDIAALLLPVRFDGIPRTFYMQFDTGSPSTILYKNAMLSLSKEYPNSIALVDSASVTTSQIFHLGEMSVRSKSFKLRKHGEGEIDWGDPTPIIIGTLGADMIDKKLTILDFKKHQCYFGEAAPDMEVKFSELLFQKRRVLFPATIEGKKLDLLYDTGTSGFELITNKETWEQLAAQGAEPEEAFKVRSWDRELTAFNIASDKKIVFRSSAINLKQVSYVDGASFMQSAIMRMTGMGGLISNQLFMGNVLILDCKNQRYSILN